MQVLKGAYARISSRSLIFRGNCALKHAGRAMSAAQPSPEAATHSPLHSVAPPCCAKYVYSYIPQEFPALQLARRARGVLLDSDQRTLRR